MSPVNWARYQKIETGIGVPAYVVGIIHSLEASLNFKGHLHNGDPLTARTKQVPAGRPKPGTPPFDWEESAIDALTLKKLDQWTDWSVAGIAYVLESYNGWGYRKHHSHVKSPYLWSFTTVYASGKYVADGTWSDTAVSKQCGGLAVLKAMIDSGRVSLAVPASPEEDDEAVVITPQVMTEEGIAPAPVAPPPYPGRLLRHGSRGEDVRMLQSRLLALGISGVGIADGDFGDNTENAVRLFQARSEDEEGEPLGVDGVVGRKTWQTLFGGTADAEPAPAMVASGIAGRALDIARAQLGVREVPLGSNRGPMVDQYLLSTGVPPGHAWCMAFVYWCYAQAAAELGLANPMPRTAGVMRSWQLAKDSGSARLLTAAQVKDNVADVEPGMVFYISTGGGLGHTGIVADIVAGRLVTVEGNTNDGGSRDGIGVFMRSKRRIDSINLGFAAFG
ncbi:peptidoglycan-binding protein [Methylobrevis pamukkalensis]|nr:peptidoglycan-binding protein [Methylobrevis pamukkalensis]